MKNHDYVKTEKKHVSQRKTEIWTQKRVLLKIHEKAELKFIYFNKKTEIYSIFYYILLMKNLKTPSIHVFKNFGSKPDSALNIICYELLGVFLDNLAMHTLCYCLI